MIHHPIDIAEMFHVAGVKNADNRVVAVAVCWAESHFNDQARLDNATLTPPGKGIDRGLMQINSFWHPEVSDLCAFDPTCNIKEAVRIYREWSSTWNAWSAFNNGAYKAFLPEAEIAVEAQVRLRALAKAKDSEKADLQAEIDNLKLQLELMRQARLAVETQLVAVTAERDQLALDKAALNADLVACQANSVMLQGQLTASENKFAVAKANFTNLRVQIFGE